MENIATAVFLVGIMSCFATIGFFMHKSSAYLMLFSALIMNIYFNKSMYLNEKTVIFQLGTEDAA